MNLEEITNKMYLEFYHLGKSNNKDTFAKDACIIAINYALMLQPTPSNLPTPYDEISQEWIDKINEVKKIIEEA